MYNAFVYGRTPVRYSRIIRVMMAPNRLFFEWRSARTVKTNVRPSCAEPMKEERRWFGRMPLMLPRQARVRPSALQLSRCTSLPDECGRVSRVPIVGFVCILCAVSLSTNDGRRAFYELFRTRKSMKACRGYMRRRCAAETDEKRQRPFGSLV